MKKVYDNIYMKRLNYFNFYVIKGKDGDILIDTGFVGMKRRLQRYLDEDTDYNLFGLDFKVVNLKGHTNGSIGVLYNNKLFAGV